MTANQYHHNTPMDDVFLFPIWEDELEAESRMHLFAHELITFIETCGFAFDSRFASNETRTRRYEY
jgi:peroxiredoxin